MAVGIATLLSIWEGRQSKERRPLRQAQGAAAKALNIQALRVFRRTRRHSACGVPGAG
ncbi:hypothetical protein D3C86_2263570 [compost metagenome]